MPGNDPSIMKYLLKTLFAIANQDVHLSSDHDHREESPGQGHTHSHSHAHPHEHGRTFAQIRRLIAGSQLSDWVKQKAVAVFQRIAAAEGKIHGLPPDQVAFHEVGAVDSIIDITGACIALEMLGKPRMLASPVVEGTGWIDCAHGRLPIPAPATLAILGARGIALSQCAEPHELVTPTGAALLVELADAWGGVPAMTLRDIGYGAGTRELAIPKNVFKMAADPEVF